ncbi:hypothetical protein D9M71_481210 [compost metagenome]
MLTDPLQVFFKHQMGKVMTNEIGCGVRFQLQACWVHTLDVASQIKGEHRVGVVGEQRPKTLLAFLQSLAVTLMADRDDCQLGCAGQSLNLRLVRCMDAVLV